MNPDSPALLWDALEAARSVLRFLEGVSEDVYLSDRLRRRAVERELEIIGEAFSSLRKKDPVLAGRIPGLPQAVGLRNILVHGYAQVVDERIYATAAGDIPSLAGVLEELVSEAGEP
jgi:uncharacterized protein with HEPN domain